MACFRLLALPDLPLFWIPSFVLWTAFFTYFFAAEPYFAIAFSVPGQLIGYLQKADVCTLYSLMRSK